MDEGGAPGPEQPHGNPGSRAEHLLGGRPLMVYVVLAAGMVVLGILLAIVWFSATGNRNKNTQACLTITVQDALAAIDSGNVDRIDVVFNPNDANFPVLLKFTMQNGRCFNGPQGTANAADNYHLLGAATFYNGAAGKSQRITIHFQTQEVPVEALETPTPMPSPTPIVVTATPVPTRPAATPVAPTSTPKPAATASATARPVIPASSPAATPAAPGTPPSPLPATPRP